MSICRRWTDFLSSGSCVAATSEAAALPALIITTEAGREDAEEARAVGANFYLVKPVSEADLRDHVAVLTGYRR